jgi:hypothetical protein
MSGESADHQRRYLVAAYDCKSGKQLWVRDNYGRYGTNPTVFLAHFPSAILDFNNDGADDWVVCSENFYGIISVKDNKDLVGPVVLSDALPDHWTAYTYPTLGALGGDGKLVAYHHGAYSMALVTDLEGKPLWHYGMTRDTGSGWGQFVDLDGDGRREVLQAQPDGLLRCFSLVLVCQCPTCLAETSSPGHRVTLDKNGYAVGRPTTPPNTKPAKSKEGGPRWQLDMGRPVSRMIAADLDADGRMEVLFGCDDGKLHALGERDGKAKLLWSATLGRRVGEPILVDLEGKGRPSILVTAEDGKLYCLKGK